jgi:CubicO group peptidase (beta-lactamase class C family)
MRLVDQGLLDIDQPISTYLGEWGEYKTEITTAQLLSNSSGLVSLTDSAFYLPYLCQYLYTGTLKGCAQEIYTADDEADRIPPDTEFHYGGGQWQLAGGIAEVVSGKSWGELVDETYFQPCSIEHTGYTNQYAMTFGSGGDLASALSYPDFFQGDIANLPQTDNPNIEGGGYATAADYARVLLMHLRGGVCDGGRVLSQEAVARMQQDRILEAYGASTPNANLQGYGLGWWIDRQHPGVFADGGAYGAAPWLDLSRNYGAIILLEANSALGRALFAATKPILDAIFDQAAAPASD